jgi:hypothetical protein
MGNVFRDFFDRFLPERRKNTSLEELKSNATLSSGFFDAEWYAKRANEEFSDNRGALRHYFEIGWRSGLDPSEAFSTSGYLAANPEVSRANINPLAHFVLIGRAQGRGPGKEHDGTSSADIVSWIEPEFDARHYVRQFPDASASGFSPLSHFMSIGWKQGRNPNAFFSTRYYIEQNADVRSAKVNPFYHFVAAGRREGRMPNPLVAKDEHSVVIRRIVGAEFDTQFYFKENPHLRGIGVDPLAHYCDVGWKSGCNPNPQFDVASYLELHADVRSAGVEPFFHFLSEGRREGRALRRTESAETPASANTDTRDVVETEFDAEYYIARYPDIQIAGVDPVAHYIDVGWKEHRDPSPSFSSKYYLDSNPDVAAAGINPFFHYLLTGKSEGRRALHPGGWKVRVLEQLRTPKELREREPKSRSQQAYEDPDEFPSIEILPTERWIISLSHDDYRVSVGGVQHCINLEQLAAHRKGWRYLHIFPLDSRPLLVEEAEWRNLRFGVNVDGKYAGVTRGEQLLTIALDAHQIGADVDLVIHSLLGHSIEMIVALFQACDPKSSLFWLHDYFSVCPSYALLRNDVTFCGAPMSGTLACRVCAFGSERKKHEVQIAKLFEALPIKVVAPSEVALEIWRNSSKLPAKQQLVLKHCKVQLGAETTTEQLNGPIRIAFLGHPAHHKGWNTFVRLVDEFKHDDRYQFVHLGSSRMITSGCEFEDVSVLRDGPSAMKSALERHQIDVALLWSIWPETFSFVAHEALAAGCSIFTHCDSGNIAKLAQQDAKHVVFESEIYLAEMMRERFETLVNRLGRDSRKTGELKFSEMSVDVLTDDV